MIPPLQKCPPNIFKNTMELLKILYEKYCDVYAKLTSIGDIYKMPIIPKPFVSLGSTAIQQHKLTNSPSEMLPINESHEVGISISFFNTSTINTWIEMNPIIIMEVKSSRNKSREKRRWIHPSNFGGPIGRPLSGNYGCGTPVSGLLTEWEFPVSEPGKSHDIYIKPMKMYKNDNGSSSISFPLKKTEAISLGLISKFTKSRFAPEDGQISPYWRNIIRFRFVIFETVNGKLLPFFGEPSNEIIIEPKIGTFSDEESWIYDFSVRIK